MKYYKSGFTIVELLVVIGLIGILSVGILATLNPLEQLKKGWDTHRKSDLAQIQKALEIYYQDNERYPPNAVNCQYQIQGNNGDGNDCITWGEAWNPYMGKIPKDINGAKRYVYTVDPAGQFYRLYTSLDRAGRDPQACNAAGTACPNVPAGVLCGGVNDQCNYGVTSANVKP